MTKLGGIASKMRGGIHPKHLVMVEEPWYLEYTDHNDTILDIGCGTGIHMMKVAPYCKKILGFDNDQDMSMLAKKNLYYYSNTSVCCHDAEISIPASDNAFDKVFLFNVLEHLNKRDFVLQEIKRVLKPNGLLLLSVPNADTRPKRIRRMLGMNPYADSDHKIEYDNDLHIIGDLIDNGFTNFKTELIVIDTLWAGLIDLIGGFNLNIYKRLAKWKRNQVFKHPEETTGWRIVCKVT